MESLFLGRNNLTLTNANQMAPKSAFYQLSLISCNISSDGIPIWLANQTDLAVLDLSSNRRITGNFPRWLAEQPINELVLVDNLLQGTLPPELASNGGIQTLDLSENNFEGEIFLNRGTNETEQSGYSMLILSDNIFTGSLGTHISDMSYLFYLDLSRNQLSGEAFVFLCQRSYSCPQYINLSFNTFHGNISIYSGKAYSLNVLEVAHNRFSNIYLPRYLEELQLLDLRENRISGEIPACLAQISSLQILSVGNNFLRGPIPSNLSNLRSLQILDLSGNKLRGRVPNHLGNLRGMIHAPPDSPILGFAQINKPIDSAWVSGPSIPTPWFEVFWKTHNEGLPNNHLGLYTLLDLSNNQLSGEIPNSLGNLRSLKVLNLSHHSLSGPIPASFGNIKELESLDLSHNNLSGDIPESMGTLLQITNLQLSDNNLSGRIPTGSQMDRMNNPDSYANNDARLCGMQILKPCNDVAITPTREAAPRGGPERDEGLWLSWMTASIGFPAGFVTTVLGMYGFGYFHHNPELLRRRRMMRRRAIGF
ncbi:unnamed protein product [Linum tenue]|uniref:Uncharacterized protein n=2 Tax=Linum tenue TaxID=586396 RepID=A0AAV0L9D8_9ROSI|nr:unnamed protein product [Linum tenue]